MGVLSNSSLDPSPEDVTAIYLTLMAFILFQVIIMFIINYIGVFDRPARALALLAQEGCRRRKKYMALETMTEEKLTADGHGDIVKEAHEKDKKADCCRPHPKWHHDLHFFEMLGNKRSYFGSVDGWFPEGKLYCSSFPKGFLEDVIFFIFNNHFWFSSFLCVRGHPFTRVQRLAAFFVQVVLCFFFTNLILVGFEVPQQTQTVIQILAITPISVILRKSFYYLESCPCLVVKKKGGDVCAKRWSKVGKFVGLLFLLGLFALHYLAAVYAGRAKVAGIYLSDKDALEKVVYSTLAVAMFSDFVIAFIKFLDGKRGVTFKACNGLVKGDNLIGGWYNHYIIENELVAGVHYKETVVDLYVIKVVYVREIPPGPGPTEEKSAPEVSVSDTSMRVVEMV